MLLAVIIACSSSRVPARPPERQLHDRGQLAAVDDDRLALAEPGELLGRDRRTGWRAGSWSAGRRSGRWCARSCSTSSLPSSATISSRVARSWIGPRNSLHSAFAMTASACDAVAVTDLRQRLVDDAEPHTVPRRTPTGTSAAASGARCAASSARIFTSGSRRGSTDLLRSAARRRAGSSPRMPPKIGASILV